MDCPAGGAAVDTSRLENKKISYCKKCLQYQLHNMIVCVFLFKDFLIDYEVMRGPMGTTWPTTTAKTGEYIICVY